MIKKDKKDITKNLFLFLNRNSQLLKLLLYNLLKVISKNTNKRIIVMLRSIILLTANNSTKLKLCSIRLPTHSNRDRIIALMIE